MQKTLYNYNRQSSQCVCLSRTSADLYYTCPRQVETLKEKMKDAEFAKRQRRRSQTEGRISIFVHQILGERLRVKGFTNRQMAVSWGALGHNVWKLAEMRKEQAERQEQEAA